MATGERKDPYRGYNFTLSIDGIERAGFQECSGLDTNQDVIEYREGNDSLTVRKLPGLAKYSNIVLRGGITGDPQLLAWRRSAQEGKFERKNMSIVLNDDTGEEKLRWNITDAWPARWMGPSFNASSNEVAIETLEICHEGMARALSA